MAEVSRNIGPFLLAALVCVAFGLVMGRLFNFLPNLWKTKREALAVRFWTDAGTSMALAVEPDRREEIEGILRWARLKVEDVPSEKGTGLAKSNMEDQ